MERKTNIQSTSLTPEIKEMIKMKRYLRQKWQRNRDDQLKTKVNQLQKDIKEKIREIQEGTK